MQKNTSMYPDSILSSDTKIPSLTDCYMLLTDLQDLALALKDTL